MRWTHAAYRSGAGHLAGERGTAVRPRRNVGGHHRPRPVPRRTGAAPGGRGPAAGHRTFPGRRRRRSDHRRPVAGSVAAEQAHRRCARAFDDTIQRLQAAFAGRAEDGAAVRAELDGDDSICVDADAARNRLALLCRDADRQHHRQRLQGAAAVRPDRRRRHRAGGRGHAPAGAAPDRGADPPPRRRRARVCRRQDRMRARRSIAPTISAMSARPSTRWRTTSPTRTATSPRRSRSCSTATRRWSMPTAPSPTSSPT